VKSALFAVVLQVAIKNAQQGVFYYPDSVSLEALFVEGGRIEAAAFVSTWKAISSDNEITKHLPVSINSLKIAQVQYLGRA